jgi:hypothetical protein
MLYSLGWVIGVSNRRDIRYDDTVYVDEKKAKELAIDYANRYPGSKWYYREFVRYSSNPRHCEGMVEIKDREPMKIFVN